MRLTCHVVPTADRRVLFKEANSLYAWSTYEITVTAEAFRTYTVENAVLVLSYAGTSYATVTLSPVAGRRDQRAGVVALTNSAFTTLCNLLDISDPENSRHVVNFGFAITISGNGASIVDDVVPVVVLPFSDSGTASQGSSTVTVDTDLDGSSTNPVTNAAISNAIDALDARLDAEEAATTAASAARTALSTSLSNHTGATSIHVTTTDKEKWNAAVTATAAQKATLAALVAAPLSGNTSTDALYTRVNAIVNLLSSIISPPAST